MKSFDDRPWPGGLFEDDCYFIEGGKASGRLPLERLDQLGIKLGDTFDIRLGQDVFTVEFKEIEEGFGYFEGVGDE